MKGLHLFLLVVITALLVPAHAQESAREKWDVAAALGPTTEVAPVLDSLPASGGLKVIT